MRSAGFGSSEGSPFSQRTLPPAASIFCFADFVKLVASTVSATASSPSPRILTGFDVRVTRASPIVAAVTSDPALKRLSEPTLTSSYSTRNGLRKPRLYAIRRTSGS